MGNKKILVVDDESDMRIFVATVVETMGLEPIVAEDGVAALEKARSLLPALVILDVMMPKIEDGIRTYQQVNSGAVAGGELNGKPNPGPPEAENKLPPRH